MRNLTILALVAVSASALAYGPGGSFAVPDNSAVGNSSLINVVSADTIVSLDSVTVTFDPGHTWAGDLILTFSNVTTGKDVHLFSRIGSTTANGVGDGSDLTGTYTFTNSGASFLAAAGAVLNAGIIAPGTYARSTHALVGAANTTGGAVQYDADDFSIFTGDAIGGDWKLFATDNASGDTTTVSRWSFEATTQAPVPEPASMVALGMGALALIRRRRNSK